MTIMDPRANRMSRPGEEFDPVATLRNRINQLEQLKFAKQMEVNELDASLSMHRAQLAELEPTSSSDPAQV